MAGNHFSSKASTTPSHARELFFVARDYIDEAGRRIVGEKLTEEFEDLDDAVEAFAEVRMSTAGAYIAFRRAGA